MKVSVEALEPRRLLYASIPAGDTLIGTVQIRPAAGSYASKLTLDGGTQYFFRVSGSAYVTSTSSSQRTYHGDAAFAAGTPVTTPAASSSSWGVTATAGGTTSDVTAWGDYQSDHVYKQIFTPSKTGALSFTWANDATVDISTIAVSVYAPLPKVQVSTVRTNAVTGSVDIQSLPKGGITIPVNNADFDQNGVADNKQSGRVVGDGFLLPITLPAVSSATLHNHYTIIVPKNFRIWQNADRTGVGTGIGYRETSDHTVYLEAKTALPLGTTSTIVIRESYDGVTVDQDIPVSTFTFTGKTSTSTGMTTSYGSDATAGAWDGAIGGTLNTKTVTKGATGTFANVQWGNTAIDGFVDYRVNADFIWGYPVSVE